MDTSRRTGTPGREPHTEVALEVELRGLFCSEPARGSGRRGSPRSGGRRGARLRCGDKAGVAGVPQAAEGRGTGQWQDQSLAVEGVGWSGLVGERWAGESTWDGVSPGPAGVTSSAPTAPSLCQEPGLTVATAEPVSPLGCKLPAAGALSAGRQHPGSACARGGGVLQTRRRWSKA